MSIEGVLPSKPHSKKIQGISRKSWTSTFNPIRDRALCVSPEYHIVRETERDRAFPYYSSLLQESALTQCNNLLHVKAAEISNKLH